jgi:hypothetical protein
LPCGNPQVRGDPALAPGDPAYVAARDQAHVLPRFPESWHWPVSANPRRSYTLLNREAPEYVRFINPSDYRVVRDSCGACHIEIIEAAERSIMSTGAMLWGGGAYNNGILPFKNYLLGEAYTREGQPARISSPLGGRYPGERARGVLAALYPLADLARSCPPATSSGCSSAAAANRQRLLGDGLPNSTGSIPALESRAGPNIRHRIAARHRPSCLESRCSTSPRQRLNDPYMCSWQPRPPGDYRHSGVSAATSVYANDPSRAQPDLCPIWPRTARPRRSTRPSAT